MTVLKIANEYILEGMCGFVDRHAEGRWRWFFAMYDVEAMLHCIMPSLNDCADAFMRDVLIDLCGRLTQKSGWFV